MQQVLNMKLQRLTIEQMLNHDAKSYNQSVWTEKVNRYAAFPKIQFYVIPKDEVYSYDRFFASYVADGIYFFNSFGYSSSLTSAGFSKVHIDGEGHVWKSLFKGPDGKEGYAENCKENRSMFRKNLTPVGVMVTNNL